MSDKTVPPPAQMAQPALSVQTVPPHQTEPLPTDATALWYIWPGEAELRPASVVAPRLAGKGPLVTVRTQWSAISRGTERLVWSGKVPGALQFAMEAPAQEGRFPFPVKYGYCAVGTVEDGPAYYLEQTVFALHPHQDRFGVPQALAFAIGHCPPRRAVLAAYVETALNGIWDSGVTAGDDVVVVGAGPLGLAVTALAAGIPGTSVTVIDPDVSRAPFVERFGARFKEPEPDHGWDPSDTTLPTAADVVFHTSATAAGLDLALRCAGPEATVVELSWFGSEPVLAPLGGRFHSKRLRLISSQVGHIPPSRTPRWSTGRRMMTALDILTADGRFDALITEEVSFSDLPRELPRILSAGAPGLVTVVRY
jgi:hypothetical protein